MMGAGLSAKKYMFIKATQLGGCHYAKLTGAYLDKN